jgi:hypothetical protein
MSATQHDALRQAADSPETSAGVRIGGDVIKATRAFAVENVTKSWWLVGSTFLMLAGALAGAALAPAWPLQLMFSLLAAPLLVRAFITYHDYMHGAILSGSRVAWILFRIYAALALTPPRSWKKSHNYHHGHVGQISTVSIGAFPIMTTQMWGKAPWTTRASYRIERHPLTVLSGYLTIFFLSICLVPLVKNPKRRVLCRAAADEHRLGAWQLPVFCPAQLQTHAHHVAGCLELLSGRDGIFELHATQQADAVGDGQHRLPPYPPSQRAYSLLSIARGDGSHSGTAVTRDDIALAPRHQ